MSDSENALWSAWSMRSAASWDLAARIAAAQPAAQIYNLHPGGGMYDTLTIKWGDITMAINRVGSLHMPVDLPAGLPWFERCIQPGGSAALAAEILEALSVKGRPRVTRRNLTYRVIARVLASRAFADEPWDAQPQMYDSSGMDGSFLQWPSPCPGMAEFPEHEVWVITRGESKTPITRLYDGWCWPPGGLRVDLMARYRGGARIDELATLVTQRPAPAAGQ